MRSSSRVERASQSTLDSIGALSLAPFMDHDALEKTDATLRFLMQAFDRVLRDGDHDQVRSRLPWRDIWAEPGDGRSNKRGFPEDLAERCVQAYSLAFQLLDQSEENAIAQARRKMDDEGQLTSESGSWEENFALLEALGLNQDDIATQLAKTRIEPVLTAHPTEAKRQTVLEHQRRLYRLIVELENSMWTRAERRDLETELSAWIDRLWRTGEIYLEKPSLDDERRMVIHYLRQVFPEALARTEQRFRSAWVNAGFSEDLVAHPTALPQWVFGNWVGGDRDGHPYVTADFTIETLMLFRRSALELVDQTLEDLAVRLSLSDHRQPTPEGLSQRIRSWASQLGDAGEAAIKRNVEEPWRQYANLLRAALPTQEIVAPGQFARANELIAALDDLVGWLTEAGVHRLIHSDVYPVMSQVRAFGFHLATVDIRQNSAYHDRALAQLLHLAGVDETETYPEWDLPRRRALLEAELHTRRPLARLIDVPEGEAQSVLQLYSQLANHRRSFGDEGIGALIVSMTRSTEDLLAIYILARDGGLLEYDSEGAFVPLNVVPLFETIEDLQRAPAILEDYLQVPVVKHSLTRQARARGLETPVQQVMVGYSDSSKDGGIVASMWGLHRCQDALAKLGQKHGVRIRFFHGRGGTIGRGAGPTHRFIRALPPGALGSDLRVTEQGETIRQKYANQVTAAHHLELLAAGTLGTTLSDRTGRSDPEELVAIMDGLASTSQEAYQSLVASLGFVRFFEHATPIDAIEASRIGSRPARRPGERKLSNLRAIPWVFAWNQSRFVLPGWFGLGTALLHLQAQDPRGFEAFVAAKTEARRWAPIHYLISNAATALATSCSETMARYAELAESVPEAPGLFQRIREEHARTQRALETVYGGPLAQARPNVHRMLARRGEALAPLHDYQISLLKAWRSMDRDDADRIIPKLLRSINAIASGLGATG
jgi:phosphoenolpyruvate carboxylase